MVSQTVMCGAKRSVQMQPDLAGRGRVVELISGYRRAQGRRRLGDLVTSRLGRKSGWRFVMLYNIGLNFRAC